MLAGNPNAKLFLNVASVEHGEFAAEALRVAKPLAGAAFDSIVATTFHPYTANPDDSWKSGGIASLGESVKAVSPNMELIQGECGAPSVEGGYGALTSLDWNETSQAKWAVRRLVTDWAHGLAWSSIFSIVDMCYEKVRIIYAFCTASSGPLPNGYWGGGLATAHQCPPRCTKGWQD